MTITDSLISLSTINPPGTINGVGSLADTRTPYASIDYAVTFFVGLLTVIAGVYFFFVLITGGLSYMSAGGDKGRIEKAKQQITLGFVGLIIIVFAVALIGILGYLIGVDFVSPGSLILRLVP